jgi:hypothetical protein
LRMSSFQVSMVESIVSKKALVMLRLSTSIPFNVINDVFSIYIHCDARSMASWYQVIPEVNDGGGVVICVRRLRRPTAR